MSIPLPFPDAPPPDLEAVIGFFTESPHHKMLGMKVLSAADGEARMIAPYHDKLIGNPDTGAVHGGLVTTLMDSTGALAALALIPAGTPIATLDLRLDYLRPAEPGKDIIGHAECFKVTPNVAFSRGTAFEDSNPDDPVANFIATYMIKPVGIGMATGGESA